MKIREREQSRRLLQPVSKGSYSPVLSDDWSDDMDEDDYDEEWDVDFDEDADDEDDEDGSYSDFD